ncbi:universal stress protein family protein [bacterium BMS3Abin04]|nr:universal stress protein family protein [bacterium BMS3Abin04]
MTILDITAIEESVGSVPLGGIYWAEKLEEAKIGEVNNNLSLAEKKFTELCMNDNVNYNLEESKGIPSDWILKKAKFYDLVLMGMRTYFELENPDKAGDTIKKVLNHSVIPILVVPENYVDIQNVLIAYDGSMQATRALHGFVRLARVLNFNVKLVNSTSDKKYAEFLRTNLKEFFEAYGIKNVEFIHTEENIIDIIDDKFYRKNDLFVIGAHSKNAVKEFFIGSLTRYLIDKNDKPIFLGL